MELFEGLEIIINMIIELFEGLEIVINMIIELVYDKAFDKKKNLTKRLPYIILYCLSLSFIIM